MTLSITSPYVYFTRANSDIEHKGGQCHRLLQILDLLSDVKLQVISSVDYQEQRTKIQSEHYAHLSVFRKKLEDISGFLTDRSLVARLYKTDFEYLFWNKNFRNTLYSYRNTAHQWVSSIHNLDTLEVALVEDPIFFLPLIKELKKSGCRIIAICNNIEALSPGQATDSHRRRLLNKEIETLSLCDLVLTISKEENYLLTNFDIKALLLPYYPDPQIEKLFLEVRNRRMNSVKKDILLLGNAHNSPSRLGMITLIQEWRNLGLEKTPIKLLVAGFGTDRIKKYCTHDNIEFLGAISNEQLKNVLTNIQMCLIFQEKGCGALTKIPELLIGDVPILANAHAARSFDHLEGIVLFSNFRHMGKILLEIYNSKINVPLPAQPDTSQIVKLLRNYFNQDRARADTCALD